MKDIWWSTVKYRNLHGIVALLVVSIITFHAEKSDPQLLPFSYKRTQYKNKYTYRRAITIDESKCGTADSSNFPMLFSGTYSYLATAANGGKVQNSSGFDIIFTSDAAGNTQLDHEIESYTATTGAVVMWVETPTLSASTNTVIYLWYGKSSISSTQENITGVWDTNFVGVYHMNDNAASTTVNDSTSNGYDGTYQANTSTKTATGQIGKTLTFNGSSDYVNIADQANFTPGAGGYTVSCWYYVDVLPPAAQANRMWLVAKGAASNYEYHHAINAWNNSTIAYGKISGSNYALDGSIANARGTATTIPATTWTFHTATTASASAVNSVYFNGALDNGGSLDQSASMTNGTAPVRIGYRAEELFFDGYIDEVRISKTARSASWITSDYNNQYSPSTFYTIGNEQ